MNKIEIDKKKCIKCGICVKSCPIGIIENDNKNFPSLKQGREEECISCWHCMAICPKEALSIAEIKLADCPAFRPELVPSQEQAEHIVRSRRSVRLYRKDPVPHETMTKLIDLARFAPTASNSQLVKWTVIDSPNEIRRLAEIVINYLRHLSNAGNNNVRYRFDVLMDDWEKGRDRIFRDAPAILLAHAPESYRMGTVDCSIALTCLDIVAPSFGVGACWAGIFMNAFANWEPLRKAVGLPEGDFCFGALMIGFPAHKYSHLPPRKEAVVSWK